LATCEYTGQDEFDGEIEFLGRRCPTATTAPWQPWANWRRRGWL
jgi:hypothetical protein